MLNLEIIQSPPEAATRTPPLLFVHGAWHDAWCWAEHFLPYFETAGYAVTALSLRGHGQSEGRGRLRWWGIGDYVEDVARVMATLSEPPVVVGHSMGGLVVQKLLERHDARGAVLLALVPPGGAIATTLRIARRHPVEFIRVNAKLSLWPVVSTPELAREAFFSATMSEENVARYFARLQDESYRAFLDMFLFALPRPGRVRAPVRVMGAAEDTIFLPYEVEATARAYGTEATIFPAMAHDMMLEPGWRDVAEAVVEWLEALILGGGDDEVIR
jgi:pimeloyl-ACP methyl ester carboxylesterase